MTVISTAYSVVLKLKRDDLNMGLRDPKHVITKYLETNYEPYCAQAVVM